MKITLDGVEIPFYQYLVEVGGSGAVYNEDIETDLLSKWRTADWAFVDDYIGHIAAQVIIEASEIDRELYNEIMNVVEKAYHKLKNEE